MPKRTEGEFIYLYWDEVGDHPEYIYGHVTMDVAREVMQRECGVTDIDCIEYVHMRTLFSQSDQYDREYREFPPGRGAFKATRVNLARVAV